MIESSDVELKLATLGKLAKTNTHRYQIISANIFSSLKYIFTIME